ncbi:hypothetical protein [Sphingobium yanoikuyae]|uniref:hypothetical protein n=1 Tax=Sphingobium yanoikuyae TaxID=13690 RepID=UPI0004E3F3D9|nr:hypothetical protein [Sphingobium yanoikuyae]KFD25590.1 hypothetical protein IH86_24930 [Sphingobium yanoikuyae]MDV3482734.1 hypothetical protein [Sphingobium yanoikuyae]
MGISIEAMDGGRLKLSGMVETLLDLPASAVTDGFAFAFSDGTLLRGHHDIGSGRCHFTHEIAGPSEVRIAREGRHDRAHISGDFTWITLVCGSRILCPISGRSADDRRQLRLDIDVKDAA